MAILDSSILTGKSWLNESIALFKVKPRKWMSLAIIYVAIFMMIPSLPGFQFFSIITVLIWPIFMVVAIVMYRNVDKNRVQNLSVIFESIKPKIQPLLALGSIMLLYGVLISLLLNSDIEGLTGMTEGMEAMTDAKAAMLLSAIMPFLLKLAIALIPMMMVTWFSPMLIALNNYSLLKAIKSSIAGSLQYMVAMGVTWLLLTLGIFALLLITGIFSALISSLLPVLGKLLMPIAVFGCLLLATALMLAFQYVSYRDVFRDA